MRPVRSTAWSWQPPHHFDGFVPTVSCMYSIDLRYHWLLNDEKWCIDDCHCSYMSLWHRPQLSLVMKNVAGIVRCTLVSAEDGKNGPRGPPASSAILAGTTAGLRI